MTKTWTQADSKGQKNILWLRNVIPNYCMFLKNIHFLIFYNLYSPGLAKFLWAKFSIDFEEIPSGAHGEF
jgi:hypothetical protein